ncbi:MAG: hypothetical protein LCH63_20955 [Candidatus Melainabacteria bacterium]|nr:hypothetical protein [Candidatus Melainabacteria bacterium]
MPHDKTVKTLKTVKPLSCKQEQFYVVSKEELERFINEQLQPASDLQYQQDQECGSDDVRVFEVTGQSDEYSRNKLARFVAGEPTTFVTGYLLDELAAKGALPKGSYLVK